MLQQAQALFLRDHQIKTIFEAFGNNENDLTTSLAYVLSKSPTLTRLIIKKFYRKRVAWKDVAIRLQELKQGKNDKGYIDIEMTVNNELRVIFEAKKGWALPSPEQIKKYLSRLSQFHKKKRFFVILSDSSKEYASDILRASYYSVPLKFLQWKTIIDLIDLAYPKGSNVEKFLFRELKEYLIKEIQMENYESNWVYVVSLSDKTPSWSKVSWMDVVYKQKHYFYPAGKNWPKTPPNYLAFRFRGRLQSVHHVEHYEVVDDIHKKIPGIKKGKLKNHYLLYLGDGFEPRKVIPNGNIWSNGRLWCMLDTLFTSKTLKEACELSKKRME